MTLLDTFLDRQAEWLQALLEHLQLSLLALVVAIFLAVPLGILLSQKPRLKEAALQVTGIFQTIPSLALLGLFIPFTGIGTLPAALALIIYAVFPILQATVTGLDEIDPYLNEAATAFGMNRWEKLKKYQLALAMPVLMSGIRTASVMIIGTATLAALVGAGGLGSFILLGIDRNNPSLILLGALSSALLALIFGGLIKLLQGQKPRTALVLLLLTVAGLGLSYFPKSQKTPESLVIAGKLGAEPDITINMYKLLIEQETDLVVEVKPNFGKTSFLYEALKAGSIDIYPEYTGTITSSLLISPPTGLSNDPHQVYELARDGIFQQDQLVYLAPSAFQNTYAVAVAETYAAEHGLTTISDLKKVEKAAVAGFSLEFADREDGNLGLINRYGLNLTVKTMEPSLRYQAIANGDVQLVDAYSTDSDLITHRLRVLADDKQLFPPYQVAPLLRQETLEKYPELETVLGKLAGMISSQEMSDMNYQVDVEGKSAEQVARDYLTKHKLLKED